MSAPAILKAVTSGSVDAARILQIVLRTVPPQEAMIDAVEDDGRTTTIRFRLVVDPVLLTERMDDVAAALARAGHPRAVLPMLRLI